MSSGFGNALRSAEKAGLNQRARAEHRVEQRRRTTHSEDWVDGEDAQQECATCGISDNVYDMYQSSDGLVCIPCFQGGEDIGALTNHRESLKRAVLRPLPWLLLTVPHLMWSLGLDAPFSDGDPIWLTGLYTCWALAWMLGMLNLPFALLDAFGKSYRAWKAVYQDTEQTRLIVGGHVWYALLYLLAVADVILFIDQLP